MTDRCHDLSCSLDEPLTATASHVERWLLAQYSAPWPERDWLRCVPADDGARLRAFARRHRCRVVLIRRAAEVGNDVGPAFFWADVTAGPEGVLRSARGSTAEVLDDGAPPPATWQPATRPVWLVCVHSTHDMCCGIQGRALVREIGNHPDVWECSHIGGDRFAANVVELPSGIYYGRVTADDWAHIPAAQSRGRIHLPAYRGRATLDRVAQWAEMAARRRFGLSGRDDVNVLGHENDSTTGSVSVSLDVTGQRRSVRLDPVATAPRLLTCKAAHEARPPAFTAVWADDSTGPDGSSPAPTHP